MTNIDPIPEVPIPASVSRHAGIGEASRNVLIRFVVDVFNRIRDSLSATIRHGLESLLESMEGPLVAMGGPIIDDVLDFPGLPESVRAAFVRVRSGSDQVGALGLLVAVSAVIMMLVPAGLSGVQAKVQQISYFVTRPALLDPQTAIRAVQLNPANDAVALQSMQGQGLTDAQIAILREIYKVRLSASDLVNLRLLGAISEGDLSARLAQAGIPQQEVGEIKQLAKQIPGPSDLVRFGLREAWRDDVAAAYGYDQGQSSEMTEWMGKLGYGPEWAQAFWRSHWEIPSSGQMIEMFHRQEISRDQLVQGLKVNDIAPGWIDPLLGITYNLLTRVDVKRALRYGEYTVDQVFQEYRQSGYDETRARILTNIALKETLDEAAGLTRSAIIAAYKKRRMTRAEALESLADIGILEGVGAFFLSQADFDRADALTDQRVDNVKKRFTAGLLTEAGAREALQLLGIGSEEAAIDVETWAVITKTTVRRPSRANLDEFVRQGIVEPGVYKQELRAMGYDDLYVNWYAGSLAFEAADRAGKEEERAQKERLRVLADRKASTYEKAKAEIDRDVAELAAAIADANVALVELQNLRDQALTTALSARAIAALDAQYKPIFREVDAAVASARLQITGVRSDLVGWGGRINDHKRSLAAGRDIVADTRLRNEKASLGTQGALHDQQIAQRRTDIARLTEGLPLAETAEQQADMKQTILEFRTEIAEFQELKADDSTREAEIDSLLPVELTAETRADLALAISALNVQIDGGKNEIAVLENGIRQTQAERLEVEGAYKAAIEAVPGRAEQIEIRSEYESRIDLVQARIVTLRANVADRRLAKTDLVVEWRG